MVRFLFDDGLTTTATNDSLIKRKKSEIPQQQSKETPHAEPKGSQSIHKKHKKTMKESVKPLLNGFNGFHDFARSGSKQMSQEASPDSTEMPQLTNGVGAQHKKKRDHAEFSTDNNEQRHSSSSTPELAKPISKRKQREMQKREQWHARIARKEAERVALGLPPINGYNEAAERDGLNTKKEKVDVGTATTSQVDPEIEFLKNKKRRKKEKQKEKQGQQDHARNTNGVSIHRIPGTSTDRRNDYNSQLTNGLSAHKTHHPQVGDAADEIDGISQPETQDTPQPQPQFQSQHKPLPRKQQFQQHEKTKLKKPKHDPQALLRHRRQLPIWDYRDSLCQALRERNILVMLGETGSGKSTQLVQFLLDEPWMKPTKKDNGKDYPPCIAITQPRRIAATSLAYRVAQELGVAVGQEVGYSVRFDNKSNPVRTRIKFLTEGMLLREMLDDPQLNRYRAVVVDEAHERTVSGDLVLGFLKGLVKKGGARSRGVIDGQKGKSKAGQNCLKVIIMSATIQVEKLAEFFEESTGADSPVEAEDSFADESGSKNGVGICFVAGRQYPVETFYTPTPIMDYVDAALRTVFQIHYAEPLPGDILVFLPGQDDIDSLERMITEHAQFLDTQTVPYILPLPLYAGLPHNLQQRVFLPAPTQRTRKVIIATNIAETSITVPGVRFVVDSGKQKSRQFRHKLGLDSLLVTNISKSSAQQRKGRAGREAAGKCYRLYTQDNYKELLENTIPEILRVDVANSILIMKARGIDSPLQFDYLDSPSRESLIKAMETLLSLGALNDAGAITSLGHSMAKLPLPPELSRVLIAALEPANIDILPDVIDIISTISTEGIIQPIPHSIADERRDEIENARNSLYCREGDHLYYLSILRGFLREKQDRRVWTQKRMISHRQMLAALEIRKQLRQYCSNLASSSSPPLITSKMGLFPLDEDMEEHVRPEKAQRILQCFLKGYFANVARLMPDGSYKTVVNTAQTVAIHPQSILFSGIGGGGEGGNGGELRGQRRKFEAIMYYEYVFTTKPYARCVSAVQLDWVVNANPGYLGRGRGG